MEATIASAYDLMNWLLGQQRKEKLKWTNCNARTTLF